MYTIGYIDDDKTTFESYKKLFKKEGMELLYPSGCFSMDEVVDWILSSNIKCMMVDYKLKNKFDFLGTELVYSINMKIPDLPCFIITSFTEDSIYENVVITNLIIDRDVFTNDMYENFVKKIKQAVNVFDKRLKKHTDEYRELLGKKRQLKISAIEEERLIDLFKLLRAYREVDDIPVELLKSEVQKTLDELIEKTNNIIKNAEKRK